MASCLDTIGQAVSRWSKAIDRRRAARPTDPDLDLMDADICLESRSCFAEFHSWVILHDRVDSKAEATLESLFRESLAFMTTEDYANSVTHRHWEFGQFCKGIPSSVYMKRAVLV
jgi:hypothetical protein